VIALPPLKSPGSLCRALFGHRIRTLENLHTWFRFLSNRQEVPLAEKLNFKVSSNQKFKMQRVYLACAATLY
jgi:hypothetical protein